MKVTVKLFATLRRDRFGEDLREYPQGITVAEVIRSIGLTEDQVTLVFINGKHAGPGSALAEGDVLALFPPIGGG